MLIFAEIWAKISFFKVISKQHQHPRNVNTFGYMAEKQFFYRDLTKNYSPQNVAIFGDMGKKQFF